MMNIDDFFFVVSRINMHIFSVIKIFLYDLRDMFFYMSVIVEPSLKKFGKIVLLYDKLCT